MKQVARFMLLPVAATMILTLSTGCELRKKMYDQPRYETYSESDFFEDGSSARPLVEGTVARGFLREDDHYYRGFVDGKYASSFPDRIEVTEALLRRGQERFDIYCSVCHDYAGYGNGMVVQRGFKQPETFHSDRLRGMPDGYYYHVISEGFGMMPSYAYQIKPEDRWAIVAYVRTLQFSQYAPMEDVPEAIRADLKAGSK
jgi:mono/diheme cytochrome c family protein